MFRLQVNQICFSNQIWQTEYLEVVGLDSWHRKHICKSFCGKDTGVSAVCVAFQSPCDVTEQTVSFCVTPHIITYYIFCVDITVVCCTATISVFFLSIFFGLYLIVQLKRETGNRGRERGSDMQQMVLRPGVKPRSAAVDQMFKNNFWVFFFCCWDFLKSV